MKTKHIIIISIDPGERYVGLVLYRVEDKLLITSQYDIQSKTNSSIYNSIETLISVHNEEYEVVVIVENFINYTHKNNIKGFKENKTSEMIGVLRKICADYEVELVLQTASQAKSWNDNRLMKLNLISKEGNGFKVGNWSLPRHTRDAYRHLIYYTNKTLFNNCINYDKLLNVETK